MSYLAGLPSNWTDLNSLVCGSLRFTVWDSSSANIELQTSRIFMHLAPFFLPKHKRVQSQTWRELQFLQSMPLTEQLAFVQTAPYVMRISRTKTAQHPKNQHGPAQTRLPYLHKKDVFQSQFPFCVNMLIFSDFKPGNTNRTRMISPCIRPPLRRTPLRSAYFFQDQPLLWGVLILFDLNTVIKTHMFGGFQCAFSEANFESKCPRLRREHSSLLGIQIPSVAKQRPEEGKNTSTSPQHLPSLSLACPADVANHPCT